MSSLVQRQSERQGIFLIALSPFKRGAGGVKYQPYILSLTRPISCHSRLDRESRSNKVALYPPPKTLDTIFPRPKNLGLFIFPLPKDLGREREGFIFK